MKSNPATNREELEKMAEKLHGGSSGKFMRSGKTDQWKKEMKPSLIFEFDKWIEENTRKYNIVDYNN